jgi:hypothetical protein
VKKGRREEEFNFRTGNGWRDERRKLNKGKI